MRWTGTSRGAIRAGLRLEELESRELLSGVQPTAVEQLFLEQLNDARMNPSAYGASIGLDLSAVAPSQPLAFYPLLTEAARVHSQDMSGRGYFDHDTPEGSNPGQRIAAEGFLWSSWGESIAGGSAFPGPPEALKGLIVDAGVQDLGHRHHLLATSLDYQGQNQVGIGIVQASAGPLINYYTIDTASSPDGGPFLTGVVMNDTNGNGKYDIGEGMGGVTVTVAGVGSTRTSDAGGYAIAVKPGTYAVTASGGGLAAPITRIVTVGQSNVRLTFAPADDEYVRKLYQAVLGRRASDAEVAPWVAVMQGPGGPEAVASGIEHSVEARTRLVKSWYLNYLGRPANNGEEQPWVARLQSGATEEDTLEGILCSDEFYNRAGTLVQTGTGDQKYVDALYSLFLHRRPGPGEVDGWTTMLSSGDRSAVVAGFIHSDEYRSDVVIACYSTLLHRQRAPSGGEVAAWTSSSLNLAGLRLGFETSFEFYMNG